MHNYIDKLRCFFLFSVPQQWHQLQKNPHRGTTHVGTGDVFFWIPTAYWSAPFSKSYNPYCDWPKCQPNGRSYFSYQLGRVVDSRVSIKGAIIRISTFCSCQIFLNYFEKSQSFVWRSLMLS